ncbi:protein of unknown function [Methylocaldum szegediense]|uniref:Uncharacterized protein n=1 Tax=Methylocaldum szegediense TaxID=73780 RepID=A0ABM9HYN1_9GAMM|nr:protein of unknown function [Methylocaldum szegediense]
MAGSHSRLPNGDTPVTPTDSRRIPLKRLWIILISGRWSTQGGGRTGRRLYSELSVEGRALITVEGLVLSPVEGTAPARFEDTRRAIGPVRGPIGYVAISPKRSSAPALPSLTRGTYRTHRR